MNVEATAQSSPRRAATAANRAAAPPAGSLFTWLSSLRVGIVLLVLLALASIAGTLIEDLERAQAVVYYTWWYKALLLALAVNMACATWRNASTKVLHANRPHFQHQRFFFEGIQPSATIPFHGTPEEVAAHLRDAGHRVYVDGQAGFATRGQWSLWGAVLAHVGFIVVLFSGFLTSWFAQEGFVQLMEGHQTSTMKLRQTGGDPVDHPLGFVLGLEDFDTAYFPQTRMPAYFRSTISARTREGLPPENALVEVNTSPVFGGWSIHQTSYQAVPQLPRYEVAVQHEDAKSSTTLEFSPGQARPVPGYPGAYLRLVSAAPFRWEVVQNGVKIQESTTNAASGATKLLLETRRFEPDFVMDKDRRITSRSEEAKNPALQVAVVEDGRDIQVQWLFGSPRLKAMMHGSEGAYNFDLKEVTGEAGAWMCTVEVTEKESGLPVGAFTLAPGESTVLREAAAAPVSEAPPEPTGPWTVSFVRPVEGHLSVLSLSSNPIIPLIYAASALMMIGLLIGFFVVRRRVWFLVQPKTGTLLLAAAYRLATDQFDPQTQRVLDRLQVVVSPTPSGETSEATA